MVRLLPLSSTLFPYTTLFRSIRVVAHLGGQIEGDRKPGLPRGQYAGFGTAEQTNARFRHLLAAGQDRKSTRLNSSHANRSYAVFFLKKKKRARMRTNIGVMKA